MPQKVAKQLYQKLKMLKDEDRIFKNLYNDLGWEIDSAFKREDWSNTKDIISKGRDYIIKEIFVGITN